MDVFRIVSRPMQWHIWQMAMFWNTVLVFIYLFIPTSKPVRQSRNYSLINRHIQVMNDELCRETDNWWKLSGVGWARPGCDTLPYSQPFTSCARPPYCQTVSKVCSFRTGLYPVPKIILADVSLEVQRHLMKFGGAGSPFLWGSGLQVIQLQQVVLREVQIWEVQALTWTASKMRWGSSSWETAPPDSVEYLTGLGSSGTDMPQGGRPRGDTPIGHFVSYLNIEVNIEVNFMKGSSIIPLFARNYI